MRLSLILPCLALIAGLLPVRVVCGVQPTAGHIDVWLRNEAGDKITPMDNASDPYSPKKTCGACHSYSTIMRGDHFQAAPKNKQVRSRIMALPKIMDGDSGGSFQVNGKPEVDCLICHSGGYRLDRRNEQIRIRRAHWAATAGASLGDIRSADQGGGQGPNRKPLRRPAVTYHWKSKSFTSEGKLSGAVIRAKTASANCLQCHGGLQAFQTGALHVPERDAHVRAGLQCTDCHGLAASVSGGRLAHHIGRGKSVKHPGESGMKTCAGCHLNGHYKPDREGMPESAPNPFAVHTTKFPKAAFHLSIMTCTACHVLAQPARGAWLLDLSTGETFWYTADRQETAVSTRDFSKPVQKPWKPWMAVVPLHNDPGKARYAPVVPHTAQWFAERTAGGTLTPIAPSVVSKAYRRCRDITQVEVMDEGGQKIRRATVATETDMEQMLKALGQMGRKQAVFVADKLYEWGDGRIAASKLPASNERAYPVWHNVTPVAVKQTYGANGCKDCHDDKAPFFGKMKVRNIGRFLKEDYPNLKTPNASPQMADWGMTTAPEYE